MEKNKNTGFTDL